jgi:hypothetical protein
MDGWLDASLEKRGKARATSLFSNDARRSLMDDDDNGFRIRSA